MLRGVGDIGRWRWTGLVLVALAMLVRVLIPAGFMAAPDDLGRAGIVICTGDGAMTVSVDADGTVHKAPVDDQHQDKPKSDHPCAFAGAATPLAAPVLALSEAAPTIHQVAVPRLQSHQRPGLGLAAPPPPTTGPPVLV
jgi:hypothetical protein